MWAHEPNSQIVDTVGDECGYSGYAACPSGTGNRFYAYSSAAIWPSYDSSCGTNTNTIYDNWVVDYAGQVTITLPNDVPENLPSNLSTGHYYTCW